MMDKYTLDSTGSTRGIMYLKRNKNFLLCPKEGHESICGTWCPAFNILEAGGKTTVRLHCFPVKRDIEIDSGEEKPVVKCPDCGSEKTSTGEIMTFCHDCGTAFPKTVYESGADAIIEALKKQGQYVSYKDESYTFSAPTGSILKGWFVYIPELKE